MPHMNVAASGGQFMHQEAEKAWDLLSKFGSKMQFDGVQAMQEMKELEVHLVP